jgi:hypothetical protein
VKLFFSSKSHFQRFDRGLLLRVFRVCKSTLVIIVYLLVIPRLQALTISADRYVGFAYRDGDFSIVTRGAGATIYVESTDFPGVVRAVGDLQADIQRVTNHNATIAHDAKMLGANAIIVGTLGKSKVIDQLIRDHRIDATAIAGKWESFLIQVVPNPLPGMSFAVVLVGRRSRPASRPTLRETRPFCGRAAGSQVPRNLSER